MIVAAFLDQRVIGYPNALPKDIHYSGKPAETCFVWPGAWEKRTMDERHCRLSVRTGDGNRKEQGVFVVDFIEIHTLIGLEGRQAQPFPMK